MEEWKKRSRIWKGFLVFLVLMWACTLISKSIYASRLPRVSTAEAQKKSIEHVVTADGIVKQGKDSAVHTLGDLRVDEIYARVGDKIEEGSPLFCLDMEDLEDTIEKKKLDIAKLEYQIKDLQTNSALEGEKKQESIDRANEDMGSSQKRTDTSIGRAEEALNQAGESLDQHVKNGVSVTSEEERQRKREEYENWLSSVGAKEQEIADREAQLPGLEQAAALALQEDQAAAQKEEEARSNVTLAEEKLAQALTPEEQEAAAAELEAAKQVLTTASANRQTAAANLLSANEQLESAKQLQTEAKDTLDSLKNNPLNEPDFSGEDSAKKSWEEGKKSLEQQKQQAQYAKEDALTAKEDALREGERKLEDADEAEKADSTLEVSQLELKQLKKELEDYREIYKAEGKVISDIQGTVTQIHITTGEKTTDGAAIVCADTTVPYQLEVTLDKDQKKYVEQGDEVTVKTGKSREELQVDFMSESESSPGSYRAVIYLPEGTGSLGMNGEVRRSDVSDSYSCCIPIAGLHKDNERYFIYIYSQRDGILGKEQYVMKKYVEVLDQNDKYAALSEGSLSQEEQVIIDSDKELKEDQVVRMKEPVE